RRWQTVDRRIRNARALRPQLMRIFVRRTRRSCSTPFGPRGEIVPIRSSHRLTVRLAVAAAASLLSCRVAEPWTPVAGPVASGGQQLTVKGTLRYTGIEGGFYQL